MSDGGPRVRWPDGVSLSVPLLPTPFGIQGTYYRNPGSPGSPRWTVTGNLAFGRSGYGPHAVFLRNGMNSEDTLGWGLSGNVSSMLPSVTVNASMPDHRGIPIPWKAKVSSIEAGLATPGASGAISYTWTPQQIAGFLTRHIFGPAMGPYDEFSSFARTLSSSNGYLGEPVAPAVKYLNGQVRSPLGAGMDDWRSSAFTGSPMLTAPSSSPEPGGLVGLLQDYLHNDYLTSR